VTLAQALPELVLDIENALVRIGRGDLAAQLGDAPLDRWTYDEFADTAYLYLGARDFDAMQADRLSLFDELNLSLDCDERGRLRGIEIQEGKWLAARLGVRG
jgi:uncharacterized protein YuzE